MKRDLAVLAALALVLNTAELRADAGECIAQHEAGVSARERGKLRDSLEQFRGCAREACPAVIRAECADTAGHVARALPTLVFSASDGQGADLVAVAVHVDGVLLTRRLDGRAYPLDPGEHTIVFEASGRRRVERRVLIRQGEKDRRIAAQLVSPKPAEPAQRAERAEPPILGYVLLGVGTVSFAAFVGFALAGRSKESELEECQPRCSPDEVDVMQTRYLIADIALAVSAVSLGGSLYLLLSSSGSESSGRAHGVAVRGAF